MARKKRTSPAVTRAQQRCSGLCAIHPQLDLGNSLTVAAYDTEIKAANKELSDYNTMLSHVDSAGKALKNSEKNLNDLRDRMLKAVATKFGTNSAEYRRAGGTPKSEIKRGRKPKASKVA